MPAVLEGSLVGIHPRPAKYVRLWTFVGAVPKAQLSRQSLRDFVSLTILLRTLRGI